MNPSAPGTEGSDPLFDEVLAALQSLGPDAPTVDPERIRAFVRDLRAARFEAPSAQSLRRALAIAKGREGALDALRRQWRTLVLTLAPPAPGLAVRSGGSGAPRLFGTDRFDVDLAPTSDGGLMVQVLAQDPADATRTWTCTLAAAPGTDASDLDLPREAVADDDGLVALTGPLPPRATLLLESSDEGLEPLRLVLEDVELP